MEPFYPYLLTPDNFSNYDCHFRHGLRPAQQQKCERYKEHIKSQVLAELQSREEEQEREDEQYFADKNAYNKQGCIGKACTRVKRFLTGKAKLRKGGKRTRKAQRKTQRK